MGDTTNKLLRKGALRLPLVDAERRVALARRIRGKAELKKLTNADVVFLSYGKSGRTWVRVMLSRAYQLRHSLPQDCLLDFDNMKRRNPSVPAIFFTHGHYIEDYTGDRRWKDLLASKKVAWLVRDPRDVAVSLYFQWKHRMTEEKIAITRYPPADPALSLYDFVMGPNVGFLARILDHAAFRAGDVHTHFVRDHAEALRISSDGLPAAIATALLAEARVLESAREIPALHASLGAWRN